ncbi:MAG: 4Fe-4S dicluster domain-containing protein [Rhodocyclaceae bacterium]|nr:4Fe-4S dicluster domain-containing protein [Rhodocyclaceae bacterium]
MKTRLDWSAFENAGQGDAYADIPATGGDFARAVAVCIRDRQCQRKPKGVMCPSFRATDDPAQSPGERVVALKAALNGELGPDPFASPQLAKAMQLCVGCKGCKRECANQLDMAAIKIEVLAQRNARMRLPLRDRLFSSLPALLRHRRLLRFLVRQRNHAPWLARLTEYVLGISAARSLPVPADAPFTAPARPAGSGDSDRDVILFVDTFAREFEPHLATAAITVLERAGYRVEVLSPSADDPTPDRPLCCGRTYLSHGRIDEARHEAERMLRALGPALARGTPVIGLEPSCILSLRDDHLKLGLGADSHTLAGQVFLFEEFIAREAQRQRMTLEMPRWQGPAVLVHGHCHAKAVGAMKSLRKVLRMVPGLDFEFIEASCCGMAGNFGLERENAAMSRRMARLDLLPALAARGRSAAVLASGFSCRHQIRDLDGRTGLHVATLLAQALVGLPDGQMTTPAEPGGAPTTPPDD